MWIVILLWLFFLAMYLWGNIFFMVLFGIIAAAGTVGVLVAHYFANQEEKTISTRSKQEREQKVKARRTAIDSKRASFKESASTKPITPEKKLLGQVDIDRLKYLPDNKLHQPINFLALKYGIEAAIIWEMVRKAKQEMPKMSQEDKQFWDNFYADDYRRGEYLDDFDRDELEEMHEEDSSSLYEDDDDDLDDNLYDDDEDSYSSDDDYDHYDENESPFYDHDYSSDDHDSGDDSW